MTVIEREEVLQQGGEIPTQYEFEAADSRGRYFPVEVNTADRFSRASPRSGSCATSLSSNEVRRALQRQNRELSILNDVATVVNQGVELDAVLDRTLELLSEQLQFDAFMATRSGARRALPGRCARFAAKDVRGHRQTRGVRGPSAGERLGEVGRLP